MKEIKCPNCGKSFEINESDYNQLLTHIRNEEFEKEVEKEKELSKKELEVEISKLKIIHEKEVNNLQNEIKNFNLKMENEKLELSNKKNEELAALNEKLKNKEEELAFVKEMKSKLSTKMIGESLEQFCSTEFEKVRHLFPTNIYFEKDNDASLNETKGDFILRETNGDEDLFSIMFEMKNESSETATKHKNEDFFKKLDKDRNDKKCEYAVLVSTLEADSDLYNSGIVDVSHKYPKMYVVRPQCFIPIITIIRNACLKSLEYKNQLALYKEQNYDFETFEKRMMDFKDSFSYNYDLASKNFEKAIEEINKTISHLQTVKEALSKSQNQLRLANDKAQGFSIRKIAKGNKSITALLDANKDNK